MIVSYINQFAATVGSACTPKHGNLLQFPTWYEHLQGKNDFNNVCTPAITSINDIWLIATAVIEIMLRVAALVAIVMIIYGAFTYVTSQGEPEPTAKARGTIVNALIGLAIAVTSAAIVSFLAKTISS